MTIKEVLLKRCQMVSYPWTSEKIKKAGFNVRRFLLDTAQEIEGAVDYVARKNDKTLKQFIAGIEKIK